MWKCHCGPQCITQLCNFTVWPPFNDGFKAWHVASVLGGVWKQAGVPQIKRGPDQWRRQRARMHIASSETAVWQQWLTVLFFGFFSFGRWSCCALHLGNLFILLVVFPSSSSKLLTAASCGQNLSVLARQKVTVLERRLARGSSLHSCRHGFGTVAPSIYTWDKNLYIMAQQCGSSKKCSEMRRAVRFPSVCCSAGIFSPTR